MSIKFTKKHLEKIIKEESQKLLSEKAGDHPVFTWMMSNLRDYFKNNFDSWTTQATQIISKFENVGGKKPVGGSALAEPTRPGRMSHKKMIAYKSSGWPEFKSKILLNKKFWQQVVNQLTFGGSTGTDINDARRRKSGLDIGKLTSAIVEAMQDYAEDLDDNLDVLDPWDGTARGSSYVDSQIMTRRPGGDLANAFYSTSYPGNAYELAQAFAEWVIKGKDSEEGEEGGNETDKPVADTENCKKAKAAIAALDNLPDGTKMPASAKDLNTFIAKVEKQGSTAVAKQPLKEIDFDLEGLKAKGSKFIDQAKDVIKRTSYASPKDRAKVFIANYYKCPEVATDVKYKRKKKGSGGGGGCPRPGFYRIIAKAVGKPANQATKDVQEVLVNLGYSVKRGMASTPFGPAGQGTVDSSPKGFKQYGIDGKCGPSTDAAIIKFQKDNGLKQDGLVGPNTYKALAAAARGEGPKTKPESQSEVKHPSLKRAIEQKKGSAILNTYIRMKRLIDQDIVNKQLEAQGGVGGKYDTKEDRKDFEKTARMVSQQMGFPEIATSGRTIIGKVETKHIQAAKTIDAALNNPEEFISKAKKLGMTNMINDPKVIQGSAKAAIIGVLDQALAESFENLDFDKWSKLWK